MISKEILLCVPVCIGRNSAERPEIRKEFNVPDIWNICHPMSLVSQDHSFFYYPTRVVSPTPWGQETVDRIKIARSLSVICGAFGYTSGAPRAFSLEESQASSLSYLRKNSSGMVSSQVGKWSGVKSYLQVCWWVSPSSLVEEKITGKQRFITWVAGRDSSSPSSFSLLTGIGSREGASRVSGTSTGDQSNWIGMYKKWQGSSS